MGASATTGPEWKTVSHSAKDFISKLLFMRPEFRLTAAGALQHNWIVSEANGIAMPMSRQVFGAQGTIHSASLHA